MTTRSQQMLTCELDIGQFRYASTGTMLARQHQHCMPALLALDLHVVDVAMGTRAALGFLVDRSQLSRYTPGDRWMVQTASQTAQGIRVECVARSAITRESWRFSGAREHHLDAFPQRHLARLEKLWPNTNMLNTMSLVLIWEIEERDDMSALIAHLAAL